MSIIKKDNEWILCYYSYSTTKLKYSTITLLNYYSTKLNYSTYYFYYYSSKLNYSTYYYYSTKLHYSTTTKLNYSTTKLNTHLWGPSAALSFWHRQWHEQGVLPRVCHLSFSILFSYIVLLWIMTSSSLCYSWCAFSLTFCVLFCLFCIVMNNIIIIIIMLFFMCVFFNIFSFCML